MKKSYILISFALIMNLGLFGQNIKLPDVTTVIEGESKKAGYDSLPPFKDVIEKSTGSGTIVPELPEVDTKKVPEAISLEKKDCEKSVFSEIIVGGGYPFLFYSDVNISGVDQANPFKFNFNFDSANGYNGHSPTDNFSDRKINMSFDKKYKYNNLKWGFFADYINISNGLQNQVAGISSVNQDFITGQGDIFYNFSNGIYIGGNIKLDLYNRYGAISSNVDYPQWIQKSSIFGFNPVFNFGWENYGFDVGLTSEYYLGANIFNDISGGNNNRGNFKLNFQWKNDIVKTYGDVSFAFGNQFTDGWFLVPFKVGVDLSLPVSFANRRLVIAGEGGLSTEKNAIADLEKKYKFTALPAMVSDSANWYGQIKVDVPVKSSFAGNIAIGYKQTAFDKGFWEPNYSDSNFVNGLYTFVEKDYKILTTDFGLTFHHKLFSIKGSWRSNWLDVPTLEPMQAITLNVSFQDEKARWGASLFGAYDVNNTNQLPMLNIDCFVQLSQKVRMTASVNDLITVFKSNSRDFAGKYVGRGFEAGLFLKFVL